MPENTAYKIVCDLYRKNRNFCSSDYDHCLQYLNDLLPLRIYDYTSNDIFNGWEIPPKWDLIKGTISRDGKTIFEAHHPLQIIGLSKPFQGTVSCEMLKQNLHFDHRDPLSTPYHFRQNYRPWDRDWGFCVTKNFYDSLQPGSYEIDIQTAESPGHLKIAEHVIRGSVPDAIAFVAHLDHPGMANDDLAGVAVGVEFFRRLSKQKLKFSYKLVLVQEIIGSIYYLGQPPYGGKDVIESCFLEMLGSKTELAIQKSRKGDTQLEKALEKVIQQQGLKYRIGPFKAVISNDEPVWESYEIPMASISRFPYPEYHSDKDNPSIISPESLEESIQILLMTVAEMEKSTLMIKNFKGVLALSNPKFNLYVDPGQPAFGSVAEESIQKLRLLMDLMPMFPSSIFVEKIAADTQLPIETVMNYLKLWEKKQLIQLK